MVFRGTLLSFLALVLAMTLVPELLGVRLGGQGMTLAMLLGLLEILLVLALAILHVRAANAREDERR